MTTSVRYFLGGLMLGGSLFLFTACEDPVHPQLEAAAPVLAVDAWLNNLPGSQTILLMQTQSYFDNSNPPGVSGAIVTVTDDQGKVFTFTEDDKNAGRYVWKPVGSETFGAVGRKYKLAIIVGGETFEANSYMGRVPSIDSITFQTDKRIASKDSITRAEFWATDPAGAGDAYWIRTYKNGVLLNKPSELNIAYDAGFSAGGETDGVTFIVPIRRGINSDDTDPDTDLPKSPIVDGDSINVHLQSITKQAFNYLNQVSVQTNRPGGFAELFSTPLANVSTNVASTKVNGSPVVGFFNVSAVSTLGKRFRKK